jgi:hypothetical protein
MKPQIVKLITGEELIANVEEHDDHYHIKNAYALMHSREGVGMMEWLPLATADAVRKVKKDHVIVLAEPIDEIKNGYLANVGGVVIASSMPNIKSGGLRLSE